MSELLIRDAEILRADGSSLRGSVAVEDGRISAVGPEVHGTALRVIEAQGRPLLPGLIDTHFHVGFHSAERDFETETRSALLGGVTTVCRYYRHLGSYESSLQKEIALGVGTSYVDFAIHLGLLTEEQLVGLPAWIEEHGIRSFKMYTCYKGPEGEALGIRGEDDGFLFDAMTALAAAGDVVLNVHSENQEIIDRHTAALQRDPPAVTDLELWSRARPPVAEAEAVRRVAFLARQAGAAVFIPHVSSDLALAEVSEAKARGQRIWAETCPHYLALDAADPVGVLAKINPPIRTAGEAGGLWTALRDGRLDVVGSDHGTTMRASKHPGDPWASAPGFAGSGTILPTLLDAGVKGGRLGLGDIARLQAQAAAIFRLAGKGRIEVGADADLVLVDLERERLVKAEMLASASDFSVFENRILRGWPQLVISRGEVVARDGRLQAEPGRGRYLRRD
jgi:dihydropyrimidinase